MSQRDVQIKENKMGVMPENKLLISMSIPMIISMLVQALYNVVDSMFVARLSEDALTAVSLVFPIQNLIIAVSVGTGVGVNALLSKSLGEKNYDTSNKTASASIYLTVINYAAFAILGAFFAKPFMNFQSSNSEIVSDGTTYMIIVCVFSFGSFFQITLEKLLQATGKTIYTMITQGLGAIINIILDPILIFGMLGFPKLGVAGAAIATVLGQTIAGALALYFNLKKNDEISFRLKQNKPDKFIYQRIYAVGAPSIVMASIGSIMVFGMNKILISFTSTATAVFGIYFKLQSFVFMPVFGINNGMVPIISYNYGARNPDRIKKTIRLSMIYAVSIMLVGMSIFLIFPQQLLSIFNASENMTEIGTIALRRICLSFTFAGFGICTLSVCQALNHGILSLIVSVVRQLLVLLPTAYILSRAGGLNFVWWAFPIAEIFAFILCMLFLRKIFREDINPMSESTELKRAQTDS